MSKLMAARATIKQRKRPADLAQHGYTCSLCPVRSAFANFVPGSVLFHQAFLPIALIQCQYTGNTERPPGGF